MHHPWETTLEELSERARGEYGPAAAAGIEAIALLRGIQPSEILEADVARSLIIGAGLKPVDFGFDPDPED